MGRERRAAAAVAEPRAPEHQPVQRDSGVAMHRQIAQQLKDHIARGRYAPGARIPTEPELSELFSVSRITARHAVEHLVREGLVLRKQGKGTFVKGPVVRHDLLELRGIYDELVEQGLNPQTELLEFGEGLPTKRASDRLHTNQSLVHWKRLYRLNGRPFGLSWVHVDPCGTRIARDTVERLPTYEILRSLLKVQIARADVAIRYEPGKAGICRAMGLAVDTPLMVLERVSYAADGRAREHTLYYAQAASYEFSITVSGPVGLVSNLKQAV